MFKRYVGPLIGGAIVALTVLAAPSALAGTSSTPEASGAVQPSVVVGSTGGQVLPLIREDCKYGQACGWTDAYFSANVYVMVGVGNFYPSGIFDNSMSSVRNVHYGTTATYYDFSGSSNKLCLPYNYENSNLAGTTLQDKISYIQVSAFAC